MWYCEAHSRIFLALVWGFPTLGTPRAFEGVRKKFALGSDFFRASSRTVVSKHHASLMPSLLRAVYTFTRFHASRLTSWCMYETDESITNCSQSQVDILLHALSRVYCINEDDNRSLQIHTCKRSFTMVIQAVLHKFPLLGESI